MRASNSNQVAAQKGSRMPEIVRLCEIEASDNTHSPFTTHIDNVVAGADNVVVFVH